MAKRTETVSKTRTGRILNSLLRKVAEEQTELAKDITGAGDDAIVSKAEALVRSVYKLALGYIEEVEVVDEKGAVIGVRVKRIPPDRYMIALIWDRLEGKVSTSDEVDDKRAKVADKVGEQGKKRIAAAGNLTDGNPN